MRFLAIARLRLLTTIRAANGIFALSLAGAVIPPTLGWLLLRWTQVFLPAGGVFSREVHFRAHADALLQQAANLVLIVYLLHFIVLTAACHVFGAVARRKEEGEMSDLTETIPLRANSRFWGDATGIFTSAALIHLCTLPFLALVVALSLLPVRVFFVIELVLLAFVALDSAAASWKLHVFRHASSTPMRSAAMFMIFALLAVMAATRWTDFRDALPAFITGPSPLTWAAVVGAVDNPPLLFTLILILYAGFIGFFNLRTVRVLDGQ